MSDTNYPTEAEGLGGIRRNSTDGSVAPALLRRRRGVCSAQRPERAKGGEAEEKERRPPPPAAAAAAEPGSLAPRDQSINPLGRR